MLGSDCSKRQRGKETLWLCILTLDAGRWHHPLRWHPWALRVQGTEPESVPCSDHSHMWFLVRWFPLSGPENLGGRWRQQDTCGQAFVFSHRSRQQGLCFQLPIPLVVEICYSAPLCHYGLGLYIWRPAIWDSDSVSYHSKANTKFSAQRIEAMSFAMFSLKAMWAILGEEMENTFKSA